MGWKFSDLTTLAGTPQATFGPAAYLFAQFTRHAIFHGFTATQGSTGHLYELYWTPGNNEWRYEDLTDDAGAPLATGQPSAYIFPNQGNQHVLYQGQQAGGGDDGRVHEIWWDEDGQHHHDLTAATGAPPANGTAEGYIFYAQNTQHAVYQGRDGHIHELWWQNGTWHHGDLSAATGAPRAGSAPGAYMFDAQGTQHVDYHGTDGRLHELWWDATGWHHNDLSAAAQAPPASDQPSGYVFRGQGTQHVDYRGTDGHIHELWWDANGWHHSSLSAVTGAPKAAPGSRPSGYAFEAQTLQPDPTQHVVYLGVDSRIHELWWNSTGWHHHDLTTAAHAPLAISSPAGFVEVDDATQHVYYNSSDHHIIELSWKAP
ncbi:hypothetical protein LVY72_05510 [Arthrobacter sp. I2-34]|uniref:Uncharacterized protein n=1 Tax=Arthrobacter hankyongi TaxID=2904801 RepID=A0ABS9L403_9MICC|nr:hypothetical protein [Arthrobacter hankyongi]MCG2621371.1 hypothetical protein [Arthrobacter hankyongi]